MKFKSYRFYIQFISVINPDHNYLLEYKTTAPHYEAAVASALAVGQQYVREHDDDRDLFMRIMA